MFFNDTKTSKSSSKRLYVIGSETARKASLAEVQKIVDNKNLTHPGFQQRSRRPLQKRPSFTRRRSAQRRSRRRARSNSYDGRRDRNGDGQYHAPSNRYRRGPRYGTDAFERRHSQDNRGDRQQLVSRRDASPENRRWNKRTRYRDDDMRSLRTQPLRRSETHPRPRHASSRSARNRKSAPR